MNELNWKYLALSATTVCVLLTGALSHSTWRLTQEYDQGTCLRARLSSAHQQLQKHRSAINRRTYESGTNVLQSYEAKDQ
jgi:hypothetical protein